MDSSTLKQITQALKGRHFRVAVDLGIGFGEYSPLLKKHCDYLIGVDRTLERVRMSGYDIIYDKLVEIDVRNYTIPAEAEAVFMFDVIEHINYVSGLTLLNKVGARFCVLTTPTKFYERALNGHASLWTEDDLINLGFKTVIYNGGLWHELFYGWEIIGIRGGSRV